MQIPLLEALQKKYQNWRSLKTGLMLTARVILMGFSYTTVDFEEDVPE